MRLPFAIAVLAVLGATTPAMAEDPADAPVATANSTSSAPVTTAEQVERYLETSPAAATHDAGDESTEPRRIHGEVGVAVGTGGDRSAYGVVSIPLGETGILGLAYGQTRYGDRGYAPPYGDYAPDHAYGVRSLPLVDLNGVSGVCSRDFGGIRSPDDDRDALPASCRER